MTEQHDVVVIGAGLVGLSVAYHLAKRGIRDVVVLEREAAHAQGSSGRSAGGVRLEFSHPSSVRFSQYGLHVLEHFEDEFGISPQFRACGYLFVTSDPSQWVALQESAVMQRDLGVAVETLAAADIRGSFAYINLPDLVGGIYGPRDGVGDPASVAYGYIRRARQLGVEVRFHVNVEGITASAGRVTGVRTASGLISTSTVVNAAGPQARAIGQMAGVDIPVHPYRRSIYVTGPFDGLPENLPMTLNLDNTSYIRREGRSILLGMSDPDEPSSELVETDPAALEKIIATILPWIPSLEHATIMRGWAGLYEISPDQSAIIGPTDDLAGFYCANGFSGHGFMHAPATGRVIAELIAGEPPFVDITPFYLSRFAHQQTARENLVI
ncbi:MAG: FAD-binding oxidoreductase [Thermaerobacter sp.]|nr:FAD-binding oxidoreductase [Thermaerobacter sp.]